MAISEIEVSGAATSYQGVLDEIADSISAGDHLVGYANWAGHGYYMVVAAGNASVRKTVCLFISGTIYVLRMTSATSKTYHKYDGVAL